MFTFLKKTRKRDQEEYEKEDKEMKTRGKDERRSNKKNP